MVMSIPASANGSHYPPITELVQNVSGLASPSDVYIKVFELMQTATSSAHDFGQVIIQDPNLTARLLRMVNSSLYGFANRIDTISRAIAVIGTQELFSLVLSVSVVQSFSKIPTQQLDMDRFWRHSVCCALIARRLSRYCGVLHPERLFIAGLLHEVGARVLWHRLPDISAELVVVAQGNEAALHQSELETFGYSHVEVGSLLLNLWGLPASLHTAVRGHHQTTNTIVGRLEAAIIKTANLVVNQCGYGTLLGSPETNKGPSRNDW